MNRAFLPALGLGLLLPLGAYADELHRQNPINHFGGLSSQDARNPGGEGWMYETAARPKSSSAKCGQTRFSTWHPPIATVRSRRCSK